MWLVVGCSFGYFRFRERIKESGYVEGFLAEEEGKV